MSSYGKLLARYRPVVRRLGVAIVLALMTAAAPATLAADKPAAAQQDIDGLLRAFPEGMTAEQIDAVLAVAKDDQIRAALRARLLAEMEARRPAGAPAADAENLLALYGRRLSAITATYPRLPQDVADAFRAPAGSEPPLAAWRLPGALLFVLGLGAAAMLAIRRLLATRRQRLTAASATGGRRAVGRLLLRLALDLLEIGAFLLGAFIAYAVLQPSHPAAPVVLFAVLRAAFVVLLADKVVRFLCDPNRRDLRLVAVDDALARALHRAIVTVIGQTAAIIALLQGLAALGLPRDDLAALALPLSVVPNGYLLLLIWSRRRELAAALARWLRLEGEQAYLAGAVLIVAAVYLVGLWLAVVDAVLREQGAIGVKAIASLALFLLIPVAAWLIHWPVGRFYGLAADAVPAPEPMKDEYGEALPSVLAAPQRDALTRGHVTRLMRAVWVVLIVLAVIVTARIWGLDPERHVGIGVAVVRIAFDISVILLIAYIGWALMVHAIDQALARAQAEGKTTRAQRMATLLPLLRKFLQVLLLAMIIMIVLSAIGVDIGPLLAGAGVVGLAIGLGTQQTVADIVAGVFFLAEDAFRVGDYVEAGSLKGTVESISLRSLKLRHQRGAVHTLPFGQIKSLTNQTRDWSLVRLEFRVAPDTDIALVKRLVKEISKDFQADPEMGPSFIEPLKSQGIRSVEDGALTIGIKYITRPGQQFVIRREAYSRLIAAFKENGIELVGRGVVVKVEGPNALTGAVAGAGAADALAREEG